MGNAKHPERYVPVRSTRQTSTKVLTLENNADLGDGAATAVGVLLALHPRVVHAVRAVPPTQL